jgi:uridine kinase
MDLSANQVVIVDGTYTSLLKFLDFRVFINRDYHQTLQARKRRARDKFEPFLLDVLEREHNLIKQHKSLADLIITPDFGRIQTDQE